MLSGRDVVAMPSTIQADVEAGAYGFRVSHLHGEIVVARLRDGAAERSFCGIEGESDGQTSGRPTCRASVLPSPCRPRR